MVPGLHRNHLPADPSPRIEFVHARRSVLSRILAHTGNSIDDLTNCPVVKNRVFGYFKLSRQIERRMEILELERQWNPLRW